MRFFRSLNTRLVGGLLLLLLLLFGAYNYVAIRFYNDQMMARVLQSTNRISDLITKSTHYSMLLNRREDVYQIIRTIGTEQAIEGIRIYNKRGEIMFSTDSVEDGTVVNMTAEACYVCHDKQKPLESLSTDTRSRIYSSGGHRILGLITPIRNEASCSNADCHAHPPERTVLGVLDVRMSLEEIDRELAQAQSKMILVATLAALGVLFTEIGRASCRERV